MIDIRRPCLVLAFLLPAAVFAQEPPQEEPKPPEAAAPQAEGEETQTLTSAYCYCPKMQYTYGMGQTYWLCHRRPIVSGSVNCSDPADMVLVYNPTLAYGDCNNGCTGGCTSDPWAGPTVLAPARVAGAPSSLPGMRLGQKKDKSAKAFDFDFPLGGIGNPHFPTQQDKGVGYIVRVVHDDGEQSYFKVFVLPMKATIPASGTGPTANRIEIFRLGFQIKKDNVPDTQVDFEVAASSVTPAEIVPSPDGNGDTVIDGLFRLRIGEEVFFVRAHDFGL